MSATAGRPGRRLLAVAAFFSLAICSSTAWGEPKPLKVLFVGNSLTFDNHLPSLVERLSRAPGTERPIDAEMIARGGDSFYTHTERRDEGAPLKVIAAGGWDVVVLQENGRLAARGGESFTFASRLVRAIRAAGATPVFYMTWAYRDRPETLPQVRETYTALGSRLEVEIAPVGDAWHLAGQSAPDIDLFDPDGVHPSLPGSYLAACVLLSTLQEQSPVDLPALGLAPDVASRLQNIARRATRRLPEPGNSPSQ